MSESEWTDEQMELVKQISEKCDIEYDERWSMEDHEEAIMDVLMEDENMAQVFNEEETELLIKLEVLEEEEVDAEESADEEDEAEETEDETEEDEAEETEESADDEDETEDEEEKPKKSRKNSLKQVFNRTINTMEIYPISVEDLIAKTQEAYGGDANEGTIKSYISWAKRKVNPFGVTLNETEDDKLEGEEL